MGLRHALIIIFSIIAIFSFGVIAYDALTNDEELNPPIENRTSEDETSNETEDVIAPQEDETDEEELKDRLELDLSNLDLYSPHVYLVNIDKGKVIEERKSEERMFPASLTKIMTAIVAIENLPGLEDSVPISEEMFPYLIERDASVAGYYPGEIARAVDLLYGTMLPSGADASIALAEYIAGSEAEFVQLMNEKAKQLSMENTHFTNVTGLHDDNHYSTVKDIYLLLKYAITNPVFLDIFTSETYTTLPTTLHPEGLTFHSTMFSKLENPVFKTGQILGGKTGYTDMAGLCLASLAKIDGERYILITTGAQGNLQTEPLHILDALSVYTEIEKQILQANIEG